MKPLDWKGLMIMTAALIAASAMGAHAQERRLPGAAVMFGVGYDYGFAVPANWLNRFTDLTSEVTTKSAGLTLILPKLFGNGFGLSTTWAYGISDLRLDARGYERVWNWASEEIDERLVRPAFDAHYREIQGQLGLYIQAGDVVRLEIGPHASIGFLPSYHISEELISPDTAIFSDGSRYWSRESSSDPNVMVAMGGLSLRASLELPLTPGLALVPSAQVRAALAYSNIEVNDVGFSRDAVGAIGSAGVGLGVIFGSTNGELIPPPPPPPTPVAPPPATPPAGAEILHDTIAPPTPPALHARVELFSQDPAGRRADTFMLSSRRTLHRMFLPLVPVLYFAPNSAALPEHYAGYTGATRASFTIQTLAGANVADVYRHGLNIIGMRMAAEPSAAITITGSAAPEESKRFAKARAEAVRDYLADTWGVDRSRMRIVPASGTAGEGDRVVSIASASREVTAPIVTEWIEESVETPPVMLLPTITAAAGLRSWHASVMHNGRQIGMLRSDGGEPEGTIDAGMVLRDFNRAGATPGLTAELVVEDSTGALALARDTLPVVLDTARATAGGMFADRTVSRHLLADTSTEETDRSITAIVAEVGRDARIEVAPRVWGNGTPDRDAAARRAETGRRLAYVEDRLRRECAREGKHLAALESRQDPQPLDETASAFPGPRRLAAPIEVTVIEGR